MGGERMLARRGLILLSTTILLSCGGNSLDAVTGGGDSGADSGSGGAGSGGAGSGGASGTGGGAGADAGAVIGSGGAIAGSGGASGSGGSADAGSNDGPAPTPIPGNSLTGTLGPLGAAKPILSAFTIRMGNQGRVYLSSAPLTCAQMMTAGWLSSAAAGSQVTEIVVQAALTDPFTIGAADGGAFKLVGEVNYAAGGKSSATEVMAKSGTILVNEVLADGGLRGTIDATFADGSNLTGTFFAQVCAGGQPY